MLYAFTDMDSFIEADLAGLWPLLSPQRKNKVERLKFFRNRKQSALAYILLRYALIQEWGLHQEVEFEYGPYGKPFIKGHPQIYFNLSHSDCGVVCALSHSPVGVDIADAVPKNLSCIRSAMHPAEQALIENSGDKVRSFARLWAMKESYLKFIGTGISEDLSYLNFSEYSSDTFDYDLIQMQVWNIKQSVIACNCAEFLPLKKVLKTDLFEILIGDKKNGMLAFA